MAQKNDAIAMRFARHLVGAMLERAGADFLFNRSRSPNVADLVVRNGELSMGIEIRYLADPHQVVHITIPASHLVIVTGAGEAVFADQTTASLLKVDHRTSLNILDASGLAARTWRRSRGCSCCSVLVWRCPCSPRRPAWCRSGGSG
ncbi:hypothetical protein [Duganella sp. BuS-21]|uniref:hypothetical protein n=1 Tax=Duganella sp. BuS-21 TaxID=2943848 RepID=UPI0035A5D6B8